jgi:hypothetical protein
MPEKPVWLAEQPDIVALLNEFLDKLDKKPADQRAQLPAVSVNDKNLPGLFVQGERADQTWVLLKSLAQDFRLLNIRPDKKRNPLDPEYFNARLRLEIDAEDMLRHWLQRPYKIPLLQQWRTAVEQAGACFPGDTAKLSSRPISLSDKSVEQIVKAFAKIGDYQHQGLTLRQLSAVCFWGRSKFLDGRRDLVQSLFPDLKLNSRPVVVNIFLPRQIDGVLFIENQDSYTCAMQGNPRNANNLALVYSAGFKSSATRIRNRGGVSLHFTGPGVTEHQKLFEQRWHEELPNDWPLWFWGDLDYAGMTILKQLIKRFSQLRAWRPGYENLLQHLRHGNAYAGTEEDGLNQIDPQYTGCAYADECLLPAIRQIGLFVDQEIVYE